MDTDMVDAGYDIDIDVGADPLPVAHQTEQMMEVSRAPGSSYMQPPMRPC